MTARSNALPTQEMTINMGPQHPSPHGVLRVILTTDGEVVTRAVPDVGYLHRGLEKIGERVTYAQYMPFTDRLHYPAAGNCKCARAGAGGRGGTRPPTPAPRGGGVPGAPPPGFLEKTKEFLDYFEPKLDEYNNLISYNKIFVPRLGTTPVVPPGAAGASHPGRTGAGESAARLQASGRRDVLPLRMPPRGDGDLPDQRRLGEPLPADDPHPVLRGDESLP